MRRHLRGHRHHGATAVEYALMLALVVAVVLVVMALLGRQVFNLFTSVPTF